MVWALISGLRGDLEAYDAVQKDLRRQRDVDSLFVLGDCIGPERDCNPLLDRLQYPRRGELTADCIYGWWEEQLLAEHGFRGERRADVEAMENGQATVTALMNAVDPIHLSWLATLQFGIIELDCALLHGSSTDVGDHLSADSSPLLLLDRLTRMDVNRLFTARSGEQFCAELCGGGIDSRVRDLEGEQDRRQSVPQRKVIGVGAGVHYTLYDPGTDRTVFCNAGTAHQRAGRGFG
ncbi:phosphoesterase [Synechococcus sp. RSCCF101]|uniref:phosphoesterase n=1 Tax=Synechococcus sp. RSCCF101 TaxID=2511069 RepID=UPI0012483D5C|nr:phosphoesterase [Synechococcus sp. RSCCF101]QEY33000.1 phosphoesterase [Synechococcus sp. RSCCF101]